MHTRIAGALGTATLTVAVPSATAAEFVVAEPEGNVVHGDSYVLTLTDPEDIAHARLLIEQGPSAGPAIVVARIAPGADGVNRDVLTPGEPLWSWHIEEFQGFVETTIEIFDGWPTFVEQDVQGWNDNTGGIIGFWFYTVVDEITACPGDCDDSGAVDFNDLTSILFHFGEVTPACDADDSGTVDFNDLTTALFLFGPCE